MGRVFQKFNAQFIDFNADFESEGKAKYLFDKETMSHEKVDALFEAYNTLYNDDLFDDSFDGFLNHMEIDFYRVCNVSTEDE